MQQPPNYYGNSYGPGSQPSYGSAGPSSPGPYQSTPYMNKPEYPTPVPSGRRATGPNPNIPSTMPPENMNTVDNDSDTELINPVAINGQEMTIYATFPDSATWHDRVFKGKVASINNENIVLYDEDRKIYTTIIAVYINFIEFTDPSLIGKPRNPTPGVADSN